MEVLFDSNAKRENKTSDILREINRINEAKFNNSLGNNELAGVVISIGSLFANQLRYNNNKYSSEDFEGLIPDFKYETKYFKHGNMDTASKIVREENSAAIIYYEERYGENSKVPTKVA